MSSFLRQPVEQFSLVEYRLGELLAAQMWHQTGRRPAQSEVRSWERSLPVLTADLMNAGLGGVEILIEYRLPLTSKRADVVLAGKHPITGANSYVVVELKQWSSAESFEGDPVLVSVAGYGHPVTHPAEQVRDYCEYLLDYTSILADRPESVRGIAYLHNATDYSVADLMAYQTNPWGRMFTGQRRGEFIDYLKTLLAPDSGAEAADALLGSRIAPSKQLLALAAETVQKREMFVLLDEQKDAYNLVKHAVEKARRSNQKTAIVVSGGPGSGKSVIALSLMGELARQGRTVMHATGSRSFTLTMRKVAAKGNSRVGKEFKFFNQFMDAEPNDLDCLILDEAHRIRETSVNRYTPKAQRTGRAQVDELLATARVPVFLLDEHQVVRPGELGSVADITAAAEAQGIAVHVVELEDQFRAGGSALYEKWVHRLLGLTPGGPVPWEGETTFEIELFDRPAQLEEWLAGHQEGGYTARMAAGFCWPWSDPTADGWLVPDVEIGEWRRPWNVKGDRSVGGAPVSALWATDPAGFGQVGCVYTAQGFEYDYAGVIFGPDMVRRGDHWVIDRAASRDPDLRKVKLVSDEEVEALIRNVYKVLLTRGMRAVGIYSTDAETRAFLKTLV